jgi:polyribonucleotide nucleotidyltransferase
MLGTVTIGAKDSSAVTEAKRRISLILDPPSAEVGEIYQGKVVNLTKFGAFVNVLPGRDGLLHISKLSPLAGGRRVGAVEDVLTLGQTIEVRVDDIDQQGKVSLSLTGVEADPPAAEHHHAEGGDGSSDRGSSFASFEDAFEAELAAELGDLGPGPGGDGRSGDRDRRRSRPRRR